MSYAPEGKIGTDVYSLISQHPEEALTPSIYVVDASIIKRGMNQIRRGHLYVI